jgi:hypothetical protein
MAGTGFSWAFTQWAPFSLVRPHSPFQLLCFLPSRQSVSLYYTLFIFGVALTSVLQLAEAILTEPDPALAGIPGSIRLADTRALTNEDDESQRDAERAAFLPGHVSDDSSDDGSEDGREPEEGIRVSSLGTNQNRVMGNLGARISRIEVSPTVDGDGNANWEVDDTDHIEEQGSRGSKPGGLSSKAGSILVCAPPVLSLRIYHRHMFAGITQYFRRDTTVSRQRLVSNNVRDL